MEKGKKMLYEISFCGYREYHKYRAEIKNFVNSIYPVDDVYFIAINEAVCNAAIYHVDGANKGKINIRIRGDIKYLETQITARTKQFDFIEYRRGLKKLSDEKGNMVWGEALEDCSHGRGVWYMVAACDYVVFDKNCNFVKLNLIKLDDEKDCNTKLRHLIHKLYIDDEGLII